MPSRTTDPRLGPKRGCETRNSDSLLLKVEWRKSKVTSARKALTPPGARAAQFPTTNLPSRTPDPRLGPKRAVRPETAILSCRKSNGVNRKSPRLVRRSHRQVRATLNFRLLQYAGAGPHWQCNCSSPLSACSQSRTLALRFR